MGLMSPGAGRGYKSSVLDAIEAEDIAALAADLVRARGENPPGGEGPTADVLAAALHDRGITVLTRQVARGRANVRGIVPGGDGPGIVILGHTDVVPVGHGWTVPPFGGLLEHGRLWGRGAADMKGGLAAAVIALAALRRVAVPLSGPVELAAVVDEEETGQGVRAYLADLEALAQPPVACLVAEPTDLEVVVAARGDSYLRVDVAGRSAHSGSPDEGINAISGAARVVDALERWHADLAGDPHSLVGPATVSVGQIRGGTGVSTVPALCTVLVDRRVLPGERPEEILEDVRRRVSDLGLASRGLSAEVTMTMEMPGFETAVTSPAVAAAVASVKEAVGAPGALRGWTASCDGGFISRVGIDVVVLGPGSVTTQAHQIDESVAIADLLSAARIYALYALRMLGPTA